MKLKEKSQKSKGSQPRITLMFTNLQCYMFRLVLIREISGLKRMNIIAHQMLRNLYRVCCSAFA
jgi:hypothetical protein